MKTKLCLVTGAGTRVGAAIAEHMLDRGYDLIAHYNHSKDGVESLIALGADAGRVVFPAWADLSTRIGIEDFQQKLLEIIANREVDVVIHSAGVMRSGRIETVARNDIEFIMNINALAPLAITQSLAPRLSAGSSMIMVSDIAADQTWREYPIYAMSKKQLELTAKHFAKALAPKTRVNVIQLGLVMRSENESEADWSARIERTPLRHPVDIEDLMAAIDHLIENRSMTGSTIVLDNGAKLK